MSLNNCTDEFSDAGRETIDPLEHLDRARHALLTLRITRGLSNDPLYLAALADLTSAIVTLRQGSVG